MEAQNVSTRATKNLDAAFDTAYHTILSTVLKMFGISGTCLNWFRSYLISGNFGEEYLASRDQNFTRNMCLLCAIF